MSHLKQKRSRGLIFTALGWQKFQTKKQDWENKNKLGNKCTVEELSELTGLSYNTVLKILDRRKGVDKRSLVKFAMAFALELNPNDYISLSSLKESGEDRAMKKVDWDRRIELPFFFGRTAELTLLEKWLVHERCRLVAIQGIGGIGKTALCIKLIEQIEHEFDCVVWRSLKEPLSLQAFLTDLLQVLFARSKTENTLTSDTNSCLRQLINYLRSHRCLLVLDNLNTLMLGGTKCGHYHKEYHKYSLLIKYIGEAVHTSCLLLTTREKPKEVAPIEGTTLPVRSLDLDGLSEQAAQKILLSFALSGTEAEQKELINRYSGHPLALTIVARQIQRNFNSKISLFLAKQDNISVEDFSQLCYQHIERLSDLEREIFYELAISLEPLSFSELRNNIPLSVSSYKIVESLESLSRRSLMLKKSEFLTIHPTLSLYFNNKIKSL